MDRTKAGGVLLTASGALLVIALLLDWWSYPPAFDRPDDLPAEIAFLAESLRDSGQEFNADGFAVFEVRDLLWLAAGIAGFAFGLVILTASRTPAIATAVFGVLAIAAAVLLAITMIAPPDYADLAPDSEKRPDFGVDLPLSRQVGGFVALAAGSGMVCGAGLAWRAGLRRSETP
jgi:hypothetical protein